MTLHFVPGGGFSYAFIVPREGFCPLKVVTRGFVLGRMVVGEINGCINPFYCILIGIRKEF